jgi:hypothetical protein
MTASPRGTHKLRASSWQLLEVGACKGVPTVSAQERVSRGAMDSKRLGREAPQTQPAAQTCRHDGVAERKRWAWRLRIDEDQYQHGRLPALGELDQPHRSEGCISLVAR